jgi:xanthine dehydrogenase iron-sulfur cluster and FAD-binding subunit A
MRQTWTTYFQPGTVPEALALLAEHGESARIVAGGTDVVVELSRGVKQTDTLIDITRLHELRGVDVRDDEIVLGGLATHNAVLASEACRVSALPLYQACLELGAPQLRTRATVAGNVATGSPANDTISALIALRASVELASIRGARSVPVEDFFPGFRQTVLARNELITAIRVPRLGASERGIFVKLGLRRAQAISVIHLAIVLRFAGEVVESARVALGCLAPTVVRGPQLETYLAGKVLDAATCREAGSVVQSDVSPIDDIRGTGAYRREVLARLVTDALARLGAGRETEGVPEAPILLESDTTYPVSSNGARNLERIEAVVNGTPVSWPSAMIGRTLLDAVREEGGLTGSKEGCAEGECGACTMWVDGQAVMSCLVPAGQVHGSQVTTIEGLAATRSAAVHPLQQAFVDQGAVQCGFCIPGMVMAGAKLLDERAQPSVGDVQSALSGNICRCTGYRKILAAVSQAAGEMAR